jgi:hypothetical protein
MALACRRPDFLLEVSNMTRHVAIVAFALALGPSWVNAQGREFTVNAASADVHNFPSTGSPVIGHAARGTVLEVTRELGSWVKIAWPDASEGAYIHLSMGSVAPHSAGSAVVPAASGPQRSAPEPTTANVARSAAPAAAPVARAESSPSSSPSPVPSPRTLYVRPPSHIVGLGGRLAGPTFGYGASARAWSRKQLGVQFELSRYELTGVAAAGRVTAIHLAPSLLYALKDRVTDFVIVRPYFGGGGGLYRQSFTGPLGVTTTVTDSSLGIQAFGGSEFTFASVPRFALSADFGYRRFQTPFVGFDLGGPGLSVAGHWYMK